MPESVLISAIVRDEAFELFAVLDRPNSFLVKLRVSQCQVSTINNHAMTTRINNILRTAPASSEMTCKASLCMCTTSQSDNGTASLYVPKHSEVGKLRKPDRNTVPDGRLNRSPPTLEAAQRCRQRTTHSQTRIGAQRPSRERMVPLGEHRPSRAVCRITTHLRNDQSSPG